VVRSSTFGFFYPLFGLCQNKDEIIGYSYGDERVQVILLWDLFKELFWDLDEEEINVMYDMFTEKVTAAVRRFQRLCGLFLYAGLRFRGLLYCRYMDRGCIVQGKRITQNSRRLFQVSR
jgi:hypothetical protein